MLAKNETREVSRVILSDDVSFDLYCEDWPKEENRIYEPDIIHAILKFARPGDCCIDAGASIGYHTMLMAKMVGANGEVLAFEPDPNYFTKLRANIELNDAKNVTLLPIPLWDEAVEMPFYVIDPVGDYADYQGLSSFVHYNHPPSTEIKTITQPLDKLVGSAQIRLLKIDCEGSEEKILRGAQQLLRRGVAAVIVEFNYKIMPLVRSSDRIMRDYMHDLGYDCFFLHLDGKSPTYIPPDTAITVGGDRFVWNALFARRAMVEELWRA